MATRSSGTRSRRSSSAGSSRRKASGSKGATGRWDFSKEEGGGGKRYREGDYLVKCLKAKPGVSEEKQTPYIEFTFKFLDGKYKGDTFTQRLYNSPKALWITRSFIEAVGEGVPDKAGDWKAIARLVLQKEVIVTITDNEHDGRIRSQVSDFLDPEEFDEDDDLDDDDLDDDEDDVDEDDDDLDEEDEEDEIEDDDEDEDEEDEKPAPRRRARKASSRKPAKKSSGRKRKPADDDEDDDLEDIDLDDI